MTPRREFGAGRFATEVLPRLRGAVMGTVMAGFAIQLALVVSGVLVARALGPTDRGYLALFSVLPTILWQLGSLGLPLATTYEVARDPGGARATWATVRRPAVLQALALIPIHVAGLALIFRSDPTGVLFAGLLTLPVVPACLAQQYGFAILQGRQNFAQFNLLRLVLPVLYSGMVLALWITGTADLA